MKLNRITLQTISSIQMIIYLIVDFHFFTFASSQELVIIVNQANIISMTVVIHRNQIRYLIVDAIIFTVSLIFGLPR